jgi:methionyl-tRNA formyltransferase
VNLHLFTTDSSALELFDLLPQDTHPVAVIVPGNRIKSAKVAKLQQVAINSGIPCFVHERGKTLSDELPPASAAISWFYSQIFGPDDLGTYDLGILNMHGGAIPEYRGANVLQWAIINGEDEIGVTWHGLVEEVDAGPIFAESRIPIPPAATATELREAIVVEGLRLFPEAWRRYCAGGDPLRYPDRAAGRVWPQRRPDDGCIKQGWPEKRLRDLVRALPPPWPPAFIEGHEGRFFVSAVERFPVEDGISYRTAEGHDVYLRPVS